MCCLPEVYNEKGSVWASYFISSDEKYDCESDKPIKNGRKQGRLRVIEFHSFGMPIKTLGSLEKLG